MKKVRISSKSINTNLYISLTIKILSSNCHFCNKFYNNNACNLNIPVDCVGFVSIDIIFCAQNR